MTPIPTPTPTPTAGLTPIQKYQLALQQYAQATPTPTPSYEVYGSAPPAPSGIGSSPGLGALIGLKLATSGGAAAAPAASSALASTAAANAAWNAPALAAGAEVGGMSAVPAGFYSSSAAAPAAAGGLGALPIAGIGIGALLAGKAGYDMFRGKKPNLLGRIVLGGATGGLSEIAKAAGLFGHKSTKEYQREKWGDLAGSAHTPTQTYANNYLNYLGSDQAKIDAQYPNTFEGKKAAGTLKAEDVWGGHGMFKTFGDDWLGKYTEDQRRAVSNALLANDLIRTSKGDQYITDEARAKELAASSIQSLLAKPANNPNSPGFKDGKRINYGKR